MKTRRDPIRATIRRAWQEGMAAVPVVALGHSNAVSVNRDD